MPLILSQIETWSTKRQEPHVDKATNNYFLLNTNRMVDIITFDTTGSQFKYCQAPNDRRSSPDIIETNSTVAQLRTAQDITPDSKFATLPIYPTLDITRTTTDTAVNTLVEWDDINYAYQTDRDIVLGVCHLVYYKESWKRTTVIVEFATLAAILLEQVA